MSPAGLPRLLVVRRGPGPLEEIAAAMAGGGYDVVRSADPDEALAQLRSGGFGIVLLDADAVGPAAPLVIAELRQQWPETAGVVLADYELLEAAPAALGEGACDYLIKPCPESIVRLAIARAAERAALARALRQGMEELDDANARLTELSEGLQERVEEATAELSRKVRELDRANRRIEAAREERDRVVAAVAHDLATPLTAIIGYAEMLGDPNGDPAVRERAARTIASEARRMARLADALVGPTNARAPKREACDLVAVAGDQVQIAQMRTTRHTLVLRAAAPVELRGDPDRLARLLSNLISNAVEHTPAGTVLVSVWREGGDARIAVSDQGPGIPPDRLEGRGPTVARERRPGARRRGLGLPIARNIAEAHGGRIWIENKPGRGATVHVSLPLRPPRGRGAASGARAGRGAVG